MTDERSRAGCSTRVSCESLVKPDRESRFLLPVREMRNYELENDSFSIPFLIPLIPIIVPMPKKCAENGQGIGIMIL